MKTFTLFLVCFFLTTSANNAFAKLKTWSEYSSENFTLYTDQRTRKAKSMLKDLEAFRAAIFTVLNFQNQAENQRLKIIMYSRKEEFYDIRYKKRIAGFFTRTPGGPRMIVGPTVRSLEQNNILYHEYIHHLMFEHSDFNYPRWYKEGFAEVFSSVKIRKKRIDLGLLSKVRAGTLYRISGLKVSELLEPDKSNDSQNYWAQFYASAWLLTHYLQISPLGTESKLKEQLSEYKRRYNEGEDSTDAFIASFGITPDEMDLQLANYQKQRRAKMLSLKRKSYDKEIIRRALSPNEALFRLSDIAWEQGKEKLAITYLNQIDVSANDAALGLSLRAILENHNDNIELAESLKQQALTLGQNNSIVLSNVAHVDWDSFNRSKKKEAPKLELLDSALETSLRASEIDPRNIDAYKFQWQSYMEQGNQIEAARSLMKAYQIDPTSINLNSRISNYLVEIQKPKLALPFAKRVYNWSHSNEQRAWSKDKLDKIEHLINKPGS